MGSIVFSTIAENIRSFFGKEEALLARPKAIPEAASEVYEHPKTSQRIVEKPLPRDPAPQLPFSPDELRAALARRRAEEAPRPVQQPIVEERDLTHEISAFESALDTVPTVSRPVSFPVATSEPAAASEGFFDEFEQFLLREDVETDGLLESDLVHRMREFHKHQQEGKEYYIYSKDAKAAIQRKLNELKTLEREWFHSRRQMDELERGLAGLEHEIESRTGEVKTLLQQAKSKSRLEQRAPQGKEFVLGDGRKLANLLDLKIALRTMPLDDYHRHVAPGRNDFAAWIDGAMGDVELASQIRGFADKHQLELFLSRLAG